MHQRRFIVALLLLSIVLMPGISISSAVSNTTITRPTTLVETQLARELATNQNVGTRALLEFKNQLTTSEIREIEATGIQFAKHGSSIINVGRIYSAVVWDTESLYEIASMGLIRATSGNKQYVPSLASSVATIRADEVWNNLKTDGQTVDGTGTTVAVLDSGADWLHPSFWRAFDAEFNFIYSGSHYYIDLNRNGNPDPGEGPILTVNGQTGSLFRYASDYMYISTDGTGSFNYAAGDRWVGGIDANHDGYIDRVTDKALILNVSKVAILYDQFSSNVYVRGVNLTQAVSIGDSRNDGHGTHVSSTIAGGQIGMTDYVGVAPGADLIIIRSPLESADILDGIDFAIKNHANVINMSFSSYLGFLDGTDPEDIAISDAFLNYGVLTTAAAGNLAGKSKHARVSVNSGGSTSVSLDVSNPPEYSYLSILWHSSDRDEHVILSPPSGDPIDLGPYSEIAGSSFALTEDALSAYVFCEVSPRGMNNIIIQLGTSSQDWMNGVWNVIVGNPSGDNILVDEYAWDGNWDTTNLKFQNATDNYHTISSPATADFAIAVSSYSEASSSIAYTSSKGPRIDGVPKPEITAPGVDISAARNSLTNLWWSKSGTSMASPHVAGTLALILQAEGDHNPWSAYSALMDGAGGETAHYEVPLNDFGHGLCNAAISVMHVLNETMKDGSTDSDWSIVPQLTSDPLDSSISPGLDLRSIKVFQEVHDVAFYITTTAASDFSGTNMLSLEWDTDSNPTTGIDGADLLLNLTSNILSIYEWNGTGYAISALNGSWWSTSTSTVLKVDGFSDVRRGNIVVATSNATMPYIDTTTSSPLVDTWLPLVQSVGITSKDDSLIVQIFAEDRDSPTADTSIGIGIVDGDLHLHNSSIQVASKNASYAINPNSLIAGYILSLSFNVTSDAKSFISPLLILSSAIGNSVKFTGASLDRSVVRTGLFIDEKITGEISLKSYELVSEVMVCFRYSSGAWRNFTISGAGVYKFVISSSGFQPGNYDVYAVAMGTNINTTEMRFATLTVVEDNTLIIVGIAVIIAGLVIIFAIRRVKK